MRIALAILLIPLSASAATLIGAVVDQSGARVPHIAVELDSDTSKLTVQADDLGVYQFSNLSAGKYTLRFQVPGFNGRTVGSILLSAEELRRMPDIPLDLGDCSRLLTRNLVLLPEVLFGTLSGSVDPSAKDVEVTLVCRTFSPCRSTKTDSSGRFSFDMLSAGVYGLNFRGPGFYLENATEYSYYVNAGWESVYGPKSLERCLNGNCDPKLRPKRLIQYCA